MLIDRETVHAGGAHIRIGADYQAELPSCLPMSVDKKSPEKAMLVWSPSFLDKSGVKASECKSWITSY